MVIGFLHCVHQPCIRNRGLQILWASLSVLMLINILYISHFTDFSVIQGFRKNSSSTEQEFTRSGFPNTSLKLIDLHFTDNQTVIHENLTFADFLNPKLEIGFTDKSLIGYPHQICGCGKYQPPSSENIQRNLSNISSSCSHEATLYGKSRKVRSYSLFIHEDEDIPRYVLPIETIIKANSEIFPGWIIRIYSNISVANRHVCGLICKYDTLFWCDIKNLPELGDMTSMNGRTWRFLALGDPTVEIFLSRDLDGTILRRERLAVAEWESSDLPFHSMRDHPAMRLGMLAGMWGAKNHKLGLSFTKPLQKKLIEAAKHDTERENLDEDILNKYIFRPYHKRMTMTHDSYFCNQFGDFKTLPFPTQRYEAEIVGESYVENVTKWTRKISPCPVDCRPVYGKDWEFC